MVKIGAAKGVSKCAPTQIKQIAITEAAIQVHSIPCVTQHKHF
jgi:hypothetical protein